MWEDCHGRQAGLATLPWVLHPEPSPATAQAMSYAKPVAAYMLPLP